MAQVTYVLEAAAVWLVQTCGVSPPTHCPGIISETAKAIDKFFPDKWKQPGRASKPVQGKLETLVAKFRACGRDAKVVTVKVRATRRACHAPATRLRCGPNPLAGNRGRDDLAAAEAP